MRRIAVPGTAILRTGGLSWMRGVRSHASRRRAPLAAGGVAAVAMTGLLISGLHDAYPTTRVIQDSGLAWVASDQIGSLTLLDGIAEQPVVNIRVAHSDGDPLLAAQAGQAGVALDETTGRLTQISDSYATLTTSESLTRAGTAVQLLAGSQWVYVVDANDSAVSVYGLGSLTPTGGPQPFGQGPSDDTAVVDTAGRLWVLDQSTGALTWFSGTGGRHAVRTFSPGQATLVLADGQPAIIDPDARLAYLVGPGGGTTTGPLALGPEAESGTLYSGAATGQVLMAINSIRGTYQTCTFTVGSCGPLLHAAFADDRLGPAVSADNRVFVPDYSTGTAWVLNPTGATPPVHTGTLTGPGPFDLFASNGLVFYNNPSTPQAGTIASSGASNPITKYSTPSPTTTGTPRPSVTTTPTTAPTTMPTKTTPAHPTPTTTPTVSTPPTPITPTPTARPSNQPSGPPSGRPTPKPSPGGSKTPSPTHTPKGGGTISCGEVITRSIVLTASLHCTGDGLIVGASNVTVDLAGHTLAGAGSGTGVTLNTSAHALSSPVLENGTISGFATGVAVGPGGANDVIISAVHFTGDGAGGAALNLESAPVAGLQVHDTTFAQSSGLGIKSSGAITGTVTISGSTIDDGVLFKEPPPYTAALTFTDDQFTGGSLYLDSVANTTITDNTFNSTPVTAMCHNGGGDLITSNTFRGPVHALTISNMAGERVDDNIFEGNTVGVELSIGNGDDDNEIDDNTFTNEAEAGILVLDTAATATPVTIDSNVASDNGGSADGATDPGGNPVIGAIHIYAPAGGIVVSGNWTSSDEGWGIWSLADTASGSGNVSSGDQKGCNPKTLCSYT